MCVMVFILTYEHKHQLILRIILPGAGKKQLRKHRILDIHVQCYHTHLNSGLLKAPREYVLHGLVPSLD
jgi:hypothetical protein